MCVISLSNRFTRGTDLLFCACMLHSVVLLTHAQGLLGTSQISFSVNLSDATATQANDPLPVQNPLNITLIYPTQGVDSDLPWIMLLVGANCYSQDYRFLEEQLAGRGYLVAVADELHPVTASTPLASPVREPQCPNNSWSAPTASVFNDVHTLLYNAIHQKEFAPLSLGPQLGAAAQKAIQPTKLDSAIIFGHSFGLSTAAAMVSGACADPHSRFCGNYTQLLDSNNKDIIKQLILWEGSFNTAINKTIFEVPNNMLVTYLSSPVPPFADPTAASFNNTNGKCKQYIRLNSGNHYAINDWNPNSAPHQRAPCGLVNGANVTVTTEADQIARLLFISELADAVIRAQQLKNTSALSFLTNDVASDILVQTANLAPEQCYTS